MKNRVLGQDFVEFMEDENWGIRDYPYSIPESTSPALGIAPTPELVSPAPEKPVPAQTVQFKEAGLFEKIPTWGWILAGIGVLFLMSKKGK
ncbi:MAG: hypothetical protein K6T87_15985 [Roseiflexus sp.]|uniref:hypothetical protein n=1 Tax=Roseiflexus sp. TaxID=2562120 RepID=UPI0025E18CA0|nr:hypothetical protein [Roseiflexus sp.]MCL6542056.1 hypothetical protein [Roseiflexus sp.]